MGRAKDLYANFFPMFLSNVTADDTLTERAYDTGLSIRGGLMWLIHKVKVSLLIELGHGYTAADDCGLDIRVAISTKKGQTGSNCPWLVDPGVIFCKQLRHNGEFASGVGFQSQVWDMEWQEPHLPPIPLASPNLSIYNWAADVSEFKINYGEAVIEYTTMEVDDKMYTEIAEVWQW